MEDSDPGHLRFGIFSNLFIKLKQMHTRWSTNSFRRELYLSLMSSLGITIVDLNLWVVFRSFICDVIIYVSRPSLDEGSPRLFNKLKCIFPETYSPSVSLVSCTFPIRGTTPLSVEESSLTHNHLTTFPTLRGLCVSKRRLMWEGSNISPGKLVCKWKVIVLRVNDSFRSSN